jgi:hypothetical protein
MVFEMGQTLRRSSARARRATLISDQRRRALNLLHGGVEPLLAPSGIRAVLARG